MQITSRAAAAIGGFIILLASSVSYAQEVDPNPNFHDEAGSTSLAEEAVSKIRSQFEALRLQEKDFKLSPGWELPLTIQSIENFFAKPLDIPVTAGHWSDLIEESKGLGDLLDVARVILGFQAIPESPAISTKKDFKTQIPPTLPPSLKTPVTNLLAAVQQAQPYLDRAVDSLSPEARQGLLSLNEWPNAETGVVKQEISGLRTKRQYEALKGFSEADLYAAGSLILKAVDAALPDLQKQVKLQKSLRWKTPQGVVLIGGNGDDHYEKKDLEGVVLLIDLGGKNTYKTPVAAAHEKEIRIAIDMGTDVQIFGEDAYHGDAGSGVFGIGILALPNSEGLKEIKTASFSQGFGMGGIGALLINGTAHLSAQRSAQGMGISGVGLLRAKSADDSTYLATRSAQGSALTRGVGIFQHEGDDADIKGGLVQPDPREPLGAVSLCQGVGFGPRAYAGGGVGLAVVAGNNISVKGSYFSQGVGYWHGFGAFRLRGDHNTNQARRYDMGSGVHSAFGHMEILGNHNRILNWGVGPSYGWDHAIASSLIQGDDNEMQTEWGAGTASIGSLSFSLIQGERNKLKLCNFGSNSFIRDEPAYSIQIIDGLDNQLQCHGVAGANDKRTKRMSSTWSLFEIINTALVENLGLVPPEWPELPREEAVEREMVDLQAEMTATSKMPPIEEVAGLVDIAAAFSLDKSTPRKAMHDLLVLPPEKASLMPAILEPAALDQLIQLSIAIPAQGDVATRAILSALNDNLTPQKRATLINFLRMARATTVAPALIELSDHASSEDFNLTCVRTMGALLNKDTGAEPGPRAGLMALSKNLHKLNKTSRKEALDLLQKFRFGESFGLLATAVDLSDADREEFFESAPEDLTSPLGEKGANSLLTIAARLRKENQQRVDAQLKTLDALEKVARSKFTELLLSTRAATINASVIGLGQIGNPKDAALIEKFLTHDNTRVRESAAVALGRIGEAALPILNRAGKSDQPLQRALVMVSVTQTVSPKFKTLIDSALKDNNPLVRLTALTVLENLPECLKPQRPQLVARAKTMLATDEDPDVRLALQLLK